MALPKRAVDRLACDSVPVANTFAFRRKCEGPKRAKTGTPVVRFHGSAGVQPVGGRRVIDSIHAVIGRSVASSRLSDSRVRPPATARVPRGCRLAGGRLI